MGIPRLGRQAASAPSSPIPSDPPVPTPSGELSDKRPILLAQAGPAHGPSSPPLWRPRAAAKPAASASAQELEAQIGRTFPGHIETAMHFALENLDPAVKSRIVAAYSSGGSFDEARFLKDFSRMVVGRLRAMDWGDVLQNDSDPDVKTFKLSQMNPALEDVGKDIVVGTVLAEGPENTLIRVLSDTRLFPKYGTTAMIGIVKAGECAPGRVTIQFGNTTFGTNSVTVVNENRNQLAQNGVQYWRLATRPPAGCPPIKDIGVNVGIESVFPYRDAKVNGHVLIYVLFATPGTQLLAGRAMKNTLNGIEDLAEGK